MSTDAPFALLQTALDAPPTGWAGRLHGARLLVTGATGFFGRWLLQGLACLEARGIALRVQCVSRCPPTDRPPAWLQWLRADACEFAQLSVDPRTTHILHMAASSDSRAYQADPLAAVRTILDGTLGVIALARRTGAHLHLVSSGAVYGARRRSDGAAREDQLACSAPEPLQRGQAYANAKRMAEALVACGLDDYSISRPFAFLGPLLPLDQHFAAGNFVRDAAAGRPIRITGDGTPLRSYLHPADLTAWLLVLLAQAPRAQAINVGGAEPVSIAGLAHEIAAVAGSPAPEIHAQPQPGADPSAYWPDTTRAALFGLSESIPRHTAIADMLAWARRPVSFA